MEDQCELFTESAMNSNDSFSVITLENENVQNEIEECHTTWPC